MKGLAVVPRIWWWYVLGVVAVGLMWPSMHGILYVLAIFLPSRSLIYAHPAGHGDLRYFDWLQTTPWKQGMPLPNGSVFPTPADGLLALLLALPPAVTAYLTGGLSDALVRVALVVFGYLLVYAAISARAMLSTGSRTACYVIVLLLLLMTATLAYGAVVMQRSDLTLFYYPAGLVVAAFVVALYTVTRSLDRYPWPDLTRTRIASPPGLLETLIYRGLPDSELGEPFTSLSPATRWKRLEWSDAVWGSVIAGAIVLVSMCASRAVVNWGGYALIVSAGIIGRYLAYYRVSPAPLWPLQWSIVSRTGYLTLFGIAVGAVGTYYLSRGLLPETLFWLVPVLSAGWMLVALKAGPSRQEYECCGLRRLNLEAPKPQSKKAPVGATQL